jgi:hypothetical protein
MEAEVQEKRRKSLIYRISLAKAIAIEERGISKAK